MANILGMRCLVAGDYRSLDDHHLAAAEPLKRPDLEIAAGNLAPGIAVKEYGPVTRSLGAAFDKKRDIPVAQVTLANTTHKTKPAATSPI